MQLKEYVQEIDIKRAIKIVLKSFINTQKSSIARNLNFKFNKYINISDDIIDDL